MKVPQLTVGPNMGGGCEPAHMGGCKYLRSTAQMCKETVKSELGQTRWFDRTTATPVYVDERTSLETAGRSVSREK